ncbi:MAG TPA: hypothetical protein DHW46_01580, partial [Halomonas sp.]|nr:hypothetical protein [Halomonas sp.]
MVKPSPFSPLFRRSDMPSYQAPLRDIRFVMDEMFDYPS